MERDDYDALLVECYDRVKRKPKEGTASAAIVEHSAACGLVAYVFGVSADTVARAVADEREFQRLLARSVPR